MLRPAAPGANPVHGVAPPATNMFACQIWIIFRLPNFRCENDYDWNVCLPPWESNEFVVSDSRNKDAINNIVWDIWRSLSQWQTWKQIVFQILGGCNHKESAARSI